MDRSASNRSSSASRVPWAGTPYNSRIGLVRFFLRERWCLNALNPYGRGPTVIAIRVKPWPEKNCIVHIKEKFTVASSLNFRDQLSFLVYRCIKRKRIYRIKWIFVIARFSNTADGFKPRLGKPASKRQRKIHRPSHL